MTMAPTSSLSLSIGTPQVGPRIAVLRRRVARTIRVFQKVFNVHHRLCPEDPLHRRAGPRRDPPPFGQMFLENLRNVMVRNRLEFTALAPEHTPESGITDAYRVLQHGVEDWPELAR